MKTLRLLPHSFSLASLCISLQKHHLQRQCFKLSLNMRKIYPHMELHLVLSGFAIKPHISQCILSRTILKAPQKLHFSIVFHIFVQNLPCVLFHPFGNSKMVLANLLGICKKASIAQKKKKNKMLEWEENLSFFCHCTNWYDLPKEMSTTVA